MVLFAIADMTLDMTLWSVRKVYDIGHWVIWGRQKSPTELLIEKQTKVIETLHKDLETINKRLEHIEKTEKDEIGIHHPDSETKIGKIIKKDNYVDTINDK